MGIKIKWALDDKENWNATHRLGDYIRYIFNDCQACVILQVNGETIVINGEDQASTEEIYNTLKDKCSKKIIRE